MAPYISIDCIDSLEYGCTIMTFEALSIVNSHPLLSTFSCNSKLYSTTSQMEDTSFPDKWVLFNKVISTSQHPFNTGEQQMHFSYNFACLVWFILETEVSNMHAIL